MPSSVVGTCVTADPAVVDGCGEPGHVGDQATADGHDVVGRVRPQRDQAAAQAPRRWRATWPPRRRRWRTPRARRPGSTPSPMPGWVTTATRRTDGASVGEQGAARHAATGWRPRPDRIRGAGPRPGPRRCHATLAARRGRRRARSAARRCAGPGPASACRRRGGTARRRRRRRPQPRRGATARPQPDERAGGVAGEQRTVRRVGAPGQELGRGPQPHDVGTGDGQGGPVLGRRDHAAPGGEHERGPARPAGRRAPTSRAPRNASSPSRRRAIGIVHPARSSTCSSTSANGRCSSLASRRPTVLFPTPIRPTSTTWRARITHRRHLAVHGGDSGPAGPTARPAVLGVTPRRYRRRPRCGRYGIGPVTPVPPRGQAGDHEAPEGQRRTEREGRSRRRTTSRTSPDHRTGQAGRRAAVLSTPPAPT